jgi:hypothetical protein
MKLTPFLMALSAAMTFGFFIGLTFPVAIAPKVEKEKGFGYWLLPTISRRDLR